jgi:A/G-specific adenine glycosylase
LRASPILSLVSDLAPVPPAARDAILGWYDERGRVLPFRGATDPYAILVSEAMAQQTQVARAGEAWLRFMDRFPTVVDLATAAPAEVLRAWQGLGYNRRAINLQRAARVIVERHGGRVPADLQSLQALPGVGPYTARAVGAIAFGLQVGAVDTNVRRVLGRIVAGDPTAIRPSDLQTVADMAVPSDRPADWTHAIMDVGASLCRPRRPDCGGCPAQPWCRFVMQDRTGGETIRVVSRGGPRQRSAPKAFAQTSRWLRGRIVDRLRAVPDGAWMVVVGPIGVHDRGAVGTALAALGREGLVELGPVDPGATGRRARLPIG